MFHEPFFYFALERPWRNGLALVQRVMAAMLLRSASRVYYSTETWTRLLARYGPQRNVEVLPIPATIPVDVPLRAPDGHVSRAGLAIGHFGTYGEHIGGELSRVVPEVLRQVPGARLLLAGRGAERFASSLASSLRPSVDVLEATDGAAIAAALRACDILVQPYPDGVTTRRTTMMAALASGVPVVTTLGPLSEPVWAASAAVALAPPADAGAFAAQVARLADPARRRDLGARGRQLYDECFSLNVTLCRLRRA
jgi:glycosyltransferase involved in cell wall biosynthesis